MKNYDIIVIGSGAGAIIADEAVAQNLRVALIDRGPLGGTCLNVGCIPSKILIFPADRVVEIQKSAKLGIDAEVKSVDFSAIMRRMRFVVEESRNQIRKGIESASQLDFYEEEGAFSGEFQLAVGGQKIAGKKIFIAAGARPSIPAIEGIDDIDYLTNESVLGLMERPESLIIVGGGYIAAEYGHFFSAMGTRVTLLQKGTRLVKEEEPEISGLLKREMERRMSIQTQTEVTAVHSKNGEIIASALDLQSGEKKEFTAEKLMIAAGRISCAGSLHPENAGIKLDERGYIDVNEFYETSQPNIWAFGDVIGKKMFRHSANREAEIVWHNSQHGEKEKLDYKTVPHAVFSYPPIASVGMVEAEAAKHHDILIGLAPYNRVAKGEAMMETESFAKIVLEKDSGKILGFHIIGSYAPMLIQEVINAMSTAGTVLPIIRGMHIHPALPEVVQATLQNLHLP